MNYKISALTKEEFEKIPTDCTSLDVSNIDFYNDNTFKIIFYQELFNTIPETVKVLRLNNINLNKLTYRKIIPMLNAIPSTVQIVTLNNNGLDTKGTKTLKKILEAIPKTVKEINLTQNNLYSKYNGDFSKVLKGFKKDNEIDFSNELQLTDRFLINMYFEKKPTTNTTNITETIKQNNISNIKITNIDPDVLEVTNFDNNSLNYRECDLNQNFSALNETACDLSLSSLNFPANSMYMSELDDKEKQLDENYIKTPTLSPFIEFPFSPNENKIIDLTSPKNEQFDDSLSTTPHMMTPSINLSELENNDEEKQLDENYLRVQLGFFNTQLSEKRKYQEIKSVFDDLDSDYNDENINKKVKI